MFRTLSTVTQVWRPVRVLLETFALLLGEVSWMEIIYVQIFEMKRPLTFKILCGFI